MVYSSVPENPSGSVLQPVQNPYDKEQKIVEANEVLFSQPLANKSPPKVSFNRIEKRYAYYNLEAYDTGNYLKILKIFRFSLNSFFTAKNESNY